MDNSRRHALPGSRWVIVENAIDDAQPGRWSVEVDIVTMVAVGGRVRSVEDYQRLMVASGLRFVRNVPATSGYQVIEAVLWTGRQSASKAPATRRLTRLQTI